MRFSNSYNSKIFDKLLEIVNMINIALEGIDNSGKTTLAKKLKCDLDKLGLNVVISFELSTQVGVLIQEYFKKNISISSEQKTLLFASDRLIRYEKLKNSNVDIVIWDRYIYSAFVYREMEGLNINWVRNVNSIFKEPNLNFYINIPIDDAIKRGLEANKPCPYTKEELLKCLEIYNRYLKEDKLILIDPINNYEDILNKIIKKTNE